jgi:DNA-binding GntR family transcriptional regulator
MGNLNTDKAYVYIRSRILSGKFPPGHALVANALSPEIGVSRTPVREALLQLEADGLVTIQARLGASVKRMELKEFRELCGLRQALESYAAGLAARERSESELQEIRFALQELRRQTEREVARDRGRLAIDEGVREDAQFHIAVMNAAKSDLLKKEILRLHLINGVMSARIALTIRDHLTASDEEAYNVHARETQAEHEAVFEAIARSDATAAEAAMKRHLQGMIDAMLRTMVRSESDTIARDLRHVVRIG